MFVYKINVMKELEKRGYPSVRMRKEKILSEGTMQNLRKGKGITTDTLNKICLLLRCQPSDVIEIIPTDEEKIKYFWYNTKISVDLYGRTCYNINIKKSTKQSKGEKKWKNGNLKSRALIAH